MNLKVVAIVLAATLLLALGALWSLERRTPDASGTHTPRVPLFSALKLGSGLSAISVGDDRGGIELAEFSDQSQLSGFILNDHTGAQRVHAGPRVDALLSLLGGSLVTAHTASDHSSPGTAVRFRGKADAAWRTISFSQSVGSPPLLGCDGSWYTLDKDLASVLTLPSLRALADLRLAPLQDERTERLELQSGPTTVKLKRTATGWAMSEPLNAVADRDAAERTRVVLTDLSVERIEWEKRADDPALGFNAPRGVVRAGRMLSRDAAGAGTELVTTLTLGANVDVAAENVYVKIEVRIGSSGEPLIGPYIGIVSTATLNRIPLAASEYFSKTAVSLAPSQIRAIRLGGGGEVPRASYELGTEGWKRDNELLSAYHAKELAGLIEWLTATRASSVSQAQRRMMPQYAARLGTPDAPELFSLGIGRSGQGAWIQTASLELRFDDAQVLFEKLELLSK